jgi:uncharacterized protein (DUF3084 family)
VATVLARATASGARGALGEHEVGTNERAKIANQGDDEADERERIADTRDEGADTRDGVADKRDGVADTRDRSADQRDRAADEREQIADKRERLPTNAIAPRPSARAAYQAVGNHAAYSTSLPSRR